MGGQAGGATTGRKGKTEGRSAEGREVKKRPEKKAGDGQQAGGEGQLWESFHSRMKKG
jgi:hypothetical protein